MSYKKHLCDKFAEKIDSFRMSFQRHSPYHIQVQVQHNFYPSKGTYYNSESGKKCQYPDFENASQFLEFLSENVT